MTVEAQSRISTFPTGVDPVKLILRIPGFKVNSNPTSAACSRGQVTTLNTPGGTPARSASSAKANADKGVSSAGLTTTGQPAASAGAALRVIIALGKFHGVISPATPTGCLIVTRRRPGVGEGITSPYVRFASSAYHSTKLAAYPISPRDSAKGFPFCVAFVLGIGIWRHACAALHPPT